MTFLKVEMSLDVLNPWMLLGLAGLALPVIAHLLSRKKYDVVYWGAMQFLELGRQAKRRIRLEELLLLALRLSLIAIIAIAMARPWLSGSLVSGFANAPTSDYVIIVDSSYSGDWRGNARTPHQQAIRWATNFLGELQPSDTVAVIDARDEPRPVVSTLTRDTDFIRNSLDTLPAPSGTSNLAEAVVRGVQLLSTGTALSRHIVVVTDGQGLPWRNADEHFWLQLEELRKQASVPADVWVVNTQKQQAKRVNFCVDRLQLSRELAVVDFPVRIKAELRNIGAPAASTRKVFLEVDGQRLAEQTQVVRIESDGQTTVEFEQRFRKPGTHLVSVVVEEDNLPADDRADAVIEISDALPVLIVDGQPHSDVTKSETFFAKAALTASGNPTPWIAAKVVPLSQLDANRLAETQVVMLANVPKLSEPQTAALHSFVESGGGLAITLGDLVSKDWYNATLFADGAGLLPAELLSIESAPKAEDSEPVSVDGESLQLPWLKKFSNGGPDSLLGARFTHWWDLKLAKDSAEPEPLDSPEETPGSVRRVLVAAKLSNGASWLTSKPLGRGQVVLLASSLDADWNTLPVKPDYVAFLHELVFDLTTARVSRNVDVGTPLLSRLKPDDRAENWQFVDPVKKQLPAISAGSDRLPQVRCDETSQPGVYRMRRIDGHPDAAAEELFVVNFDRSESDLNAVTDDTWKELTAEGRLRRIDQPSELFDAIKSQTARVEIWRLLMLAFLAILVGEVVMTRKLVQGGHVFVDDNSSE